MLQPYYIQRSAPQNLQAYFPSLEVLFPSIQQHNKGSPTLAAAELILDLSGTTATVENLVTKEVSIKEVWTRQIHLVDPIDVMSGDMILPSDGSIPTFRSAWQTTLRKINDPYNEAYTATVASNLVSRLVELDISPHFCRFYGTYTGRVPEYRFNLSDYIDDIEDEPWFHEGIRSGAFQILAVDPDNAEEGPYVPWNPETFRPLNVGGSIAGSYSDSDSESESTVSESSESSTDLIESDDIPADGEVVLSRPRIRLERSNAESHSSGSFDSSPDLNYVAILKNYPVQLTYLERCDGTMDTLMDDEHNKPTEDMIETRDARWTAWIFQIVAALTAVQHHFDLIHNDLHTNNIVWSGTGETHLYYHIKGSAGGDRYYKVPTYGRLFKIIDYGRATFRIPSEGQNNPTWFPDVYGEGSDAEGQYNCGPFFNKDRPKVSPNKSFDLCRMAVAMLDAVWPTTPPSVEPVRPLTSEQNETVSPIWNLLWHWLTDTDGRNILRLPSGRERYPDFDLYCAIAATSKNAVPAQQLTCPVFDNAFRTSQKNIEPGTKIWTLQAHPPKSKMNKNNK